MKVQQITQRLALFVLFLLTLNICVVTQDLPNELSSIIETIDNYMTNSLNTNQDYAKQIEEISKVISVSAKNHKNFINLKISIDKISSTLKDLSNFKNKVSSDLEKIYNKVRVSEEELSKVNKIRNSKGYALISKLLNNLQNPNIVKKAAEDLFKIVRPNNRIDYTKKSLRQFSRFRMWSSYRIEEILEDLKKDNLKGENLTKACISSFLRNAPMANCWKQEFYNPIIKEYKCPPNYDYVSFGLCIKKCHIFSTQKGLLCLKSCPWFHQDCGLFCSKTSCENKQDYIAKENYVVDLIDSYSINLNCPLESYKESSLCIKDCSAYGMVNCDIGKCAFKKQYCDNKPRSFEDSFVDSFGNYIGFLFSIQTGKPFGWSDKNSFKSTIVSLKVGYLNYFENLLKDNINVILDFVKSPQSKNLSAAISQDSLAGLNLNDEELKKKTVGICKSITDELFDIIRKLPNSNPFGWNNDELLQDYSVCDSGSKKYKECSDTVIQLVKRLGPLYLLGISSQFNKPECKQYK
jgi:hypothetical protein